VPTIAYLANQFPSPVEWYVIEEIEELRRRGAQVVPCSSRRPLDSGESADYQRGTLYLWPPRKTIVCLALLSLVMNLSIISEFLRLAVSERRASITRRGRALIHTLLGVYYAELLRGRGVEHIHVHHGYFSSWVAMVAARLLGVPFSITLHGSDVLLDSAYLEMKLQRCAFCFTISEFNRRHILRTYPEVGAGKVQVQRLGVAIPRVTVSPSAQYGRVPILLSVGRLHPVKNYAFLVRACHRLRESGVHFRCVIVGDGPERQKLALLIRRLGIDDVVALAGHVPHRKIGAYYELADLFVLTSRSEGIPLVLMEAMAHARVVLAPAITGIPELVIDRKTGYLFRPGDLQEFVWRVQHILGAMDKLGPVREAARAHVRQNFERKANVEKFADKFLQQVARNESGCNDEDFVLQQI